jgi:undecaprenyl-diphosphatase
VLSALLQLNYMLFQEINAPAGSNAWFDALMIFCANSLIFCWPLLLLIVWGRPLTWRKQALQSDEAAFVAERRATVLWVVVACIVAYGLNLLIEQFVFEPRPFIGHKVHLLITHAADASFPSDHTAWSFAVLGMLLFTIAPPFLVAWRKRSIGYHASGFASLTLSLLLLIAALVIAIMIGLARIYVGVHYPDDILGGAIDGLIAAYAVTILRRWLRQPTNAVLRFAHTLRLA